jgi:hypothetical protein
MYAKTILSMILFRSRIFLLNDIWIFCRDEGGMLQSPNILLNGPVYSFKLCNTYCMTLGALIFGAYIYYGS